MNNTPSISQSPLGTSLELAPSQLFVADLAAMTTFYRDQVGLEVLGTHAQTVTLGDRHTPIIELVQAHNLSVPAPGAAGLFHNAIVYTSQTTLAQQVGRLLETTPHLFTGTGDHLVSEAFYFNDPEGNGLEMYFDRPATTWQWKDGQIVMDTLYIDPLAYIMQHGRRSTTQGTNHKLGHIHLRVGDIPSARHFYVNLLGFNVTADWGSALFVSIGGYHHHIGLNTWMSADAPKRTPSLGLSEIKMKVASDRQVQAAVQRLEQNNYSHTYSHGRLSVSDPWGNQLVLQAD